MGEGCRAAIGCYGGCPCPTVREGRREVLHTSFRVGYCPTSSPISEMLLVSQSHALLGPRTVPGHQSIAQPLRFRAICLVPEGSQHTAVSPLPLFTFFFGQGQARDKDEFCTKKNKPC